MTQKARLLSGRVPVTDPTAVTSDRYQFLGLDQAEPNLGTAANGNVLTTNIYGARTWSNSISLANLTVVNVAANTVTVSTGLFWSNGVPFTAYGNADVTGFLSSYTGNITAGNVVTTGNITASYVLGNGSKLTGMNTYANIDVAGYLPTYTGNITANNATVTGSFRGNIFADIITPYQTTITAFNSSTAIKLPVGDNSTRPTGVAGYIRYSTAGLAPEYYNGTDWISVNNTIVDQNFSGDGVNATYTLSQPASQSGILVSINGTLQQPGTAYTVSVDQITFAEIPLTTDVIDVRFLGALVTMSPLVDDLTVSGNITSGNIIPSANVTYSLGSATNQWKDLWVSNNTIYIGNTPVRVSGGSLLINGAAISGTYSNTNVAAYLPSNGTITGIQANLGAYQTYANSNSATQATSINSINANIGSFYSYANANAATQATAITSLATNANTNTAAYLANGISTNISTSGNVTASGISPFYAPNRPAFRITGNGGSISATTTVSGGYMVVDYNQGSYLNTTTGLFTAPVSGLYQVNIVVRTNSNTNGTINQIIIRKTAINGGAVTAQIMVEFGTNTSMNHAGGSTIVKMEAGDTLKFDVAVGTISFDGNDNWSVAYIG